MIANLKQLVLVNSDKTTSLLEEFPLMDEELRSILRKMESEPESLFLLLRSLLVSVHGAKLREECDLLKEAYLHEKLVDLMCKFDPAAVESLLEQSYEVYRTDVALSVSFSISSFNKLINISVSFRSASNMEMLKEKLSYSKRKAFMQPLSRDASASSPLS